MKTAQQLKDKIQQEETAMRIEAFMRSLVIAHISFVEYLSFSGVQDKNILAAFSQRDGIEVAEKMLGGIWNLSRLQLAKKQYEDMEVF